MTDNLPTVWDGPEHTFAKHRILEAYLQAWMAIMSRQAQLLGIAGSRLLFVDGFAGPGSYVGGEDGSPILAIKSALEHSQDFHVPIDFLFIEKDKKRCDLLRQAVGACEREVGNSPRIRGTKVENDDCEAVLNKILDDYEEANRKLGPGFFFLDQFGYSDVPMSLIRRIMDCPVCEVFSYLNWDHMSRFLSDKSKWSSMDSTFGDQEWRNVLHLDHSQRPRAMVDVYRRALKEKGSSKYVWHFAMCDDNDKLLYWLFFCTNSLRGLEEMKKAMWRVDQSGGFRFSDKEDPSQLRLFQNYSDNMLANDLFSAHEGKVLSVGQIKEFVLTETPAHKYKPALQILEMERSKLRVPNPPPGRRRGTFPDEKMEVEFFTATPETLWD